MKVILLRDIPKIGKKDEVKDVADGYAQNALLPKKLAKIATPQELASLEARKRHEIEAAAALTEGMKAAVEELKKHKLVISMATNKQGHLFSKFKVEQLRKVFREKGIEFDAKYVVPFEIREAGIHTIKIKSPQLSDDFTVEIKGIE